MKSIQSILIFLFLSFSISGIAQDQSKTLKLEDFFKRPTFRSHSVYGLNSMNDGIHYSAISNGDKLIKYSYKTGDSVSLILDLQSLKHEKLKYIGDYSFSDDEKLILLSVDRESIYRWSFVADYFIINLETGIVRKLSDGGKQQLATFSPDCNKVAFVRGNNLFITYLDTGEERQITFDGKYNYIINGAPDWVYEEEFSFNKAFAWSPDGQRIAYMRFDESAVKEFNMTVFKGSHPEMEENALYPENRSFKYPKAGEDNSLVSVHVYDITSQKTSLMNVGDEDDQYIPRIKWTNDPEILCIYRLNRLQNKLELLLADANSGKTEIVYTDENEYYIDENNFDFLTFTEDDKFIILNESDGYTHIYVYTMDGELLYRVNEGEYDVTDFYGYDPDKKLIYYQSAERSPLNRDVYSIRINGKSKKRLSIQEGTNRAVFSKAYKYFINYHSNINTPPFITLHQSTGRQIRVLEDNKQLRELLKGYKYRPREFYTFKTSDSISLNAWLIKPYDFDSTKKYPVLFYQYSGPGSQTVRNQWSFSWYQYLAQLGYVVISVDGRGTGARGEAFKKSTYLQLGKYETIDQIEAAKHFGSKAWVDKGRIGIWGWSYGGFMTLSCLTKGEGIYKMGIAVAPVTSWRYYDNIYTERFMRKPSQNESGYDENAPLNYASELEGDLLIVHGTADDNVHVQNTLEFTEALVQADIDFEMRLYTNRNHGIYGGNTSWHLFTKILDFIENKL